MSRRPVRMYHPTTGGSYDAPESAVPTLQMSGWVPADQVTAQAPSDAAAAPLTDPDPKARRGRRTSKED